MDELASRTVTLLVTRLGGATDADVQAYDRIVRLAVLAHGGELFGEDPRGLAAAFPVPGDALGAAVDGQRALATEPQEDGRPLLVRMALHTGPARKVGSRYVGPAVEQAARLLDGVEGGQVLVSGPAGELIKQRFVVAEEPPPPPTPLARRRPVALETLPAPEEMPRRAPPTQPRLAPRARTPRLEHATTLEHEGVLWVLTERPGDDEQGELAECFGLDAGTLAALSDPQPPTRAEERDGRGLLVLHVPVLLARPRRLVAAPLRLVLGGDYVLAVHGGELRSLVGLSDVLVADPERRDQDMASAAGLAREALAAAFAGAAPLVERLGADVEAVQGELLGTLDGRGEELGSSATRALALRVAVLRRDAMTLGRMLEPAPSALAAFALVPALGQEAASWRELAATVGRLSEAVTEAQRVLGTANELLRQLSAERTRMVLRGLTIVAALTLPMLAVAAAFAAGGRELPAALAPWGFELLLALMLVAGIGTVGLLRRRGWL